MSTAMILNSISQQVSIYFGIPLLIAGLLGGILNIIVFISLKTFRQSSCAFYLLILSLVNLGQLLSGLLSRIMINGFSIDWTQNSLFYCKFRYFILQTCALISCACICLAILDQYFATCSRPRWQQWSHLKIAYYLTSLFTILSILHGIFYFIFFVHVQLNTTNEIICAIVNHYFANYHSYGYLFSLTSISPVIITVIVGGLVYRNVQQIAYRTIPLVRRELDKQLTNMVLKQVIINFFTVLPYAIITIVLLNTSNTNTQLINVILRFLRTITIYLYYLNYASPFYIYVCVSERFRRQLIYVFFDVHLNRCRRLRITENQIVPQT